jgi:hypothetical protein
VWLLGAAAAPPRFATLYMSDWATIAAGVNAAMQDAFGEPVVYQSVQGGIPVGDAVTVDAIRHVRERGESGAAASTEEISINPADLPADPQPGDWVTAWGTQFVVGPVRQPDPYGMVQLSLIARQSPDDQP